jgi:hypothetical protein
MAHMENGTTIPEHTVPFMLLKSQKQKRIAQRIPRFQTVRIELLAMTVDFLELSPRCEPWCWHIKTYIYPKNQPVL